MYSNRKKRKHIEAIGKYDIDYLVRKDPVTCACYCMHRIDALKQLLCHVETFFVKILDFYFVIGFQNRGSAHEHGLLWTENAPIYGKNNNLEIKNFLDKYITCNIDNLDPNLAKMHEHCHMKSFRNKKEFTLYPQLSNASNEKDKNS